MQHRTMNNHESGGRKQFAANNNSVFTDTGSRSTVTALPLAILQPTHSSRTNYNQLQVAVIQITTAQQPLAIRSETPYISTSVQTNMERQVTEYQRQAVSLTGIRGTMSSSHLPTCFLCNMVGHYASYCPQKQSTTEDLPLI